MKEGFLDWLKARNLTPEQAKEQLKQLERANPFSSKTFKHDFTGRSVRIGVLGDSHFGNKWTDKSFLRDCYKKFKAVGCEAVYHTGDIVDGPWQRHHNVLEQYAQGIENQVKDTVENYPTGLDTYLIDGNHDGWYTDMGAGSPGKLIQAQRPDIHYLGRDEALIHIGKVSVMLSHPADGSAYAYSYKAQKMMESIFRMDEDMPDVILQGHYHKMFQMRTAHTTYYCTGTTCRQTPWMRGKKLVADLGAWVIDVQRDKRGNLNQLTSTQLIYNGDKHTQTC